MRLLAFLVAIAVLFALSDSSVAQEAAPAPSASALGLRLLTWPGKVAAPTPLKAAVSKTAAKASALPASIYDPAPAAPARPAPAPQALAQAQPSPSSAGVHFYSLHREYGQQPDPISLGPQFLSSATPDLAAPPAEPPRTVTTSSGQVRLIAPDDPAAAVPGSG